MQKASTCILMKKPISNQAISKKHAPSYSSSLLIAPNSVPREMPKLQTWSRFAVALKTSDLSALSPDIHDMASFSCCRDILLDWSEKYSNDQGSVVQSIVSLTPSLRRQLVKYMPTKLSNTLLFFVGKM